MLILYFFSFVRMYDHFENKTKSEEPSRINFDVNKTFYIEISSKFLA